MPKSRLMAFTWSTLKNLFSKPVTRNYPAEPINYPEGSRGHIEIEIDKCISCSLCAKNCPPGAIRVDKAAGTWTINRFDCIACGYCTMKCPKKCLHLVPGYQTPGTEKAEATYTRPKTEKPAAGAAAAGKAASGAGAASGASPAAGKASLNGDILTLPNGKTMDLSKMKPEARANALKKFGLDKPAAPAAAAEGKASLDGDILTLPNGKTMDLSKMKPEAKAKALARFGLDKPAGAGTSAAEGAAPTASPSAAGDGASAQEAPAGPQEPAARLEGDILTLPNGKTMDLSKLKPEGRANVLKKVGLEDKI